MVRGELAASITVLAVSSPDLGRKRVKPDSFRSSNVVVMNTKSISKERDWI